MQHSGCTGHRWDRGFGGRSGALGPADEAALVGHEEMQWETLLRAFRTEDSV